MTDRIWVLENAAGRCIGQLVIADDTVPTRRTAAGMHFAKAVLAPRRGDLLIEDWDAVAGDWVIHQPSKDRLDRRVRREQRKGKVGDDPMDMLEDMIEEMTASFRNEINGLRSEIATLKSQVDTITAQLLGVTP